MKAAIAFLTALGALAVLALVLRRLLTGEREAPSEEPRIAPVPRAGEAQDVPGPETALVKPETGTTLVATEPEPEAEPGGAQERVVTAVGRNQRGSVQSLHGDWGKVTKDEAVEHIESGRFSYHVGTAAVPALRVVPSSRGKYLRSAAGTPNLDSLPPAD